MVKLEIKTIKGKKYLYIRDKIKVNDKSVAISFYIGRLEKTTPDRFLGKLAEYQTIRLKTFTDFWLKKQRRYLDGRKAQEIELLHYSYRLFSEYYPDELRRYESACFARYVQGTTAIEGNTITLRQAEELLEHDDRGVASEPGRTTPDPRSEYPVRLRPRRGARARTASPRSTPTGGADPVAVRCRSPRYRVSIRRPRSRRWTRGTDASGRSGARSGSERPADGVTTARCLARRRHPGRPPVARRVRSKGT